jgi:hypothetical protein
MKTMTELQPWHVIVASISHKPQAAFKSHLA